MRDEENRVIVDSDIVRTLDTHCVAVIGAHSEHGDRLVGGGDPVFRENITHPIFGELRPIFGEQAHALLFEAKQGGGIGFDCDGFSIVSDGGCGAVGQAGCDGDGDAAREREW